MKTVDLSEAESQLSSLLSEIEREPLAIERDGSQVAFIVSPAEFFERTEEKRRAFLEAWDALSAEIEEKAARGEIDIEDLMKSLDRKAS